MHHLFLSDVHFGAFAADKQIRLEKDLISLIQYCKKNNIYLHVLGDLFDYWMEFDNYVPPLGTKILNCFEEYHQTAGKTCYVTGNHDFWTIGHFKQKGFDVYTDYTTLQVNGLTIFLFHGDGVSDTTYNLKRPFLNTLLRKTWFTNIYRFLFSGPAANRLMEKFSAFTRNPEGLNPNQLNEWANILLTQYPFDAVFCGHDHIPRMETFNDKFYINCGAFHKDYTLGQYTNTGFDLVKWNSSNKSLTPFQKVLNTSAE